MIDTSSLITQIQTTVTNLHDRPTDLIGFDATIANALTSIINQKEICFFDEKIKSDSIFHYLDFPDMLEKSEIMIFNIELSEKYLHYLSKLNKQVIIFIPKEYKNTIATLEKFGFRENMLYCN